MKIMNGIILFMSIITCIRFFTVVWNISNSILILGELSLHVKTKFQNKTKTRPPEIFATSCRHFSLATFFQLRYIIKRQTCAKNVL